MVLIRLVLSSIPIFQMSVSVLPSVVKQKLHGMFSLFLWGSSLDKNKMYLVNWVSVMALVISGGLGILDLGDMNKALARK